ncbi:MAG: hypothetical protein AABY32_01660 [Nanoarchaeota archaeon]
MYIASVKSPCGLGNFSISGDEKGIARAIYYFLGFLIEEKELEPHVITIADGEGNYFEVRSENNLSRITKDISTYFDGHGREITKEEYFKYMENENLFVIQRIRSR